MTRKTSWRRQKSEDEPSLSTYYVRSFHTPVAVVFGSLHHHNHPVPCLHTLCVPLPFRQAVSSSGSVLPKSHRPASPCPAFLGCFCKAKDKSWLHVLSGPSRTPGWGLGVGSIFPSAHC